MADPEKYDFFEPRGWARAVARFPQRTVAGTYAVILHGLCPRCKDRVDLTIPLQEQLGNLAAPAAEAEAVSGEDEAAAETDHTKEPTYQVAEPFEITVLCNCHVAHPGRPEDVKEGCGAFGNLAIG